MLQDLQIDALSSAVDDAQTQDVADLTLETRASERRIHKALPINSSSEAVLDELTEQLMPLLTAILQTEQDEELPLMGSGFMRVFEGADEQELHKDVHGSDRHGPIIDSPQGGGGPRAVSIQIQLTDTTSSSGLKSGSLEVLPGSHRPDAARGSSEVIKRATETSESVVPIDVPAGSVTIYSARLWHRGGANVCDRERIFCFLTLSEPGSPAPPGLIHTMVKEDIGSWVVGQAGLYRRSADSG